MTRNLRKNNLRPPKKNSYPVPPSGLIPDRFPAASESVPGGQGMALEEKYPDLLQTHSVMRPASTPSGQPPLRESIPARNPSRRKTRRLPSWLVSWHLWTTIGILSFGGAGLVAANFLFRLPMLPNCPAIYWPLASASMRLSCAQGMAERRTSTDLLQAIELVNALPLDHPMRPAINRYIEQWAKELLDLSEQDFQSGKLDEAIAHARKIPTNTSAYRLVNDRVLRWRKIWSQAEEIYRQAEAELRKLNWHQAFWQAVRLQAVGNTYWETTRYQQFLDSLRQTRSESNKLFEARELAETGNLDNLLKALQVVNGVRPNSYLYQEARRLVTKFGRQFMDQAEATLTGGDLQTAIAVARRMPAGVGLKREVQDFISLGQAALRARSGQIADLEAAIAQAQQLAPGRPLYGKAQDLVARWQLEIEGVSYLERAREVAKGGTVNELLAAISEAETIPRSNPMREEAQREISRWYRQIETIQDRPYLDAAQQLAAGEDIASLQAAIDQAQKIRSGRALYGEAQGKIQEWTDQIQTIQDQPYLDQAEQLAQAGDYRAAIDAAEAIQSGRALYRDAQAKIRGWKGFIEARQNLQEAYRLATSQTPEALGSAIQVVNRIPAGSDLRSQADTLVNQWSRQLLALAETQAMYNLLDQAIAIAQKIPAQADVYSAAQQDITTWKQRKAGVPAGSPPQ
ncbi:hypothetical protein BST81_07605 [Leptolyngbya sp. 'hensonii']|uniref:hypothetical protein n=1 Tax=Leptolyngbya sp. 'hensonii' TaxID=1922337 RepID=UPI00094F58C3|nr:hypothetical protein [Leptolyngbya sp. 'hensonii']OLP19069.1 hypothetical protein BST81_07605 [Leptolyngbya sp. 'hensonii']